MKKRVLIVEDEIFVALEIEHIVQNAGLEVCAIAADRAAAFEAADYCDIALVDLNLRDGPTGPQIGQALAERGVRVIYVTANPSQIGGASVGALGAITKPFRDATIRDTLRLAAQEDPDPTAADIMGFTPFMPTFGSMRDQGYSA
ncbi:response regulator [Sphingobium sp. H39-3-25]|uniref:response regulator n=1 Tax=Sphingobium arseniciresistens TaxID=3030834 RepID=UPI0023B983E6|nr:response regulator [Sphingobium arseniciresistens]